MTTVCPTGAPTVVCEFWPIHEMASVKSNHRAKDGAAWTAVYSITHGRHHLEADASSSSTRAQRANIRTPTPTPTTRRSAIIGVIVSRNRETGPGSPALRFLRVHQRLPWSQTAVTIAAVGISATSSSIVGQVVGRLRES